MHVKKKSQHGWCISVTIGSGLALAITLVLLGMLTCIKMNKGVGEGSEEIIIYALKLVGIIVGANLAKRVHGKNDIRLCLTVAIVYFAVTMIGGLLADGRFEDVWVHLLVICIGSILSCALCIYNTGRIKKRKKTVW